MTSLIGSTPGAGGFTGNSPAGFNNISVPVYIVWYDKPGAGNGWTTAQKTLVTEWVNNIQNTSWWSFLRDYPSALGGTASGMHYVASIDDPENEGTDLGSHCQLAITNSITNGLPSDPIGHYMVIPNDTEVTAGPADAFHGGTNTIGSVPYSISCYTRPSSAYGGLPGNPPNGDAQFDSEMFLVSHEIAESLVNGVSNGSVEIADKCNQLGASGALFMSHGFTTTVGGTLITANLTFTDSGTPYYFWAQDVWSFEQGGHCINGQTPANLSDNQPCVLNSDCTWSHQCSNSGGSPGNYCAIPTCSDGVKNENESATDCGATCGFLFGTTKTCSVGQTCFTDWDCTSQNCNPSSGRCQ